VRRAGQVRRLRVGYVSGDLHEPHPVSQFMLPVLQHHDRNHIEVFIYQTGHLDDAATHRMRECAEHWRDAAQLDDLALHQCIVEDHIDVLVDLAGHNASHRLGAFALRAAPAQLSYLGYPHSTGLPFIDWVVADAWWPPPRTSACFASAWPA